MMDYNTIIYISAEILADDMAQLVHGLETKFDVVIYKSGAKPIRPNIYITNNEDDCGKYQLFDKIILMSCKNNYHSCSLVYHTTGDIINYILSPSYKLGLTYLIDGNSGMDKTELHNKLRSWSLITNNQRNNIEYINQGPGNHREISESLFHTKCILRNIIDKNSISYLKNIKQLYEAIKNTYSDYATFIPNIVSLNEINPLLFQGKKFHIRSYLMITTIGKIYLFSDHEIIISHSVNEKGYFYPKDLPDEKINTGIKLIIDKIIGIMKSADHNKILPINNDKYGYQIIAIDTLIDDKYNSWLIDIDINPIFRRGSLCREPSDEFKEFDKSFLLWEYNSIIKPIFSKVILVPLYKATDKMIDELLNLTTNETIMENIGKGELWDRDKIGQLIKEDYNDQSIEFSKRKYFNWIICLKYGAQTVVGFASLRPMLKTATFKPGPRDLQIRIFTYPSQGYGTNIIKLIMKFASKNNLKLWATIHTNNIISINFFEKLGWKQMEKVKLSGYENVVLKAPIDTKN